MIRDLFYISGIAVNIGLLYTLYKINTFESDFFPNDNCLIKKEETGEHNLHSSQSVGHIFEKKCEENNSEQIIEERLRKINSENNYLKNWLNYIPSIVSKNK